MSVVKLVPILMIVLLVVAAVIYAVTGDVRRAIYWSAVVCYGRVRHVLRGNGSDETKTET